MSGEQTIDTSDLQPNAWFWRSKRRGFRLGFKKPNSSNGWVFGFWYRVIIALVCTVPAWIALILLGATNNYSLEPWMFVVSVSLAVFPLTIAEILRRSVFERVVRLEAETVEVQISQTGLKLTASDHRELERLERKTLTDSGTFYRDFGKRFLDVFLVLTSSVAILPLTCIIAIFISMDGHPPFYSQRRVGRNGREFRMFKLRTMTPNADERLLEYLKSNPAALSEWNTNRKLQHDPRITPLGIFLRSTSLDELPQLWNVLKGDMSLVGPRPILPEQTKLYPGTAYYSVRPGVTGLWQVSHRTDTSFSAREQIDRMYVRHLTCEGDLRILMKTVSVVSKDMGL